MSIAKRIIEEELNSFNEMDYRKLLSELSPVTFISGEDRIRAVLLIGMPDDKYSVHFNGVTSYYDLEKLPDHLRINLLLTRGRYGTEFTGTVHEIVDFDLYSVILDSTIHSGVGKHPDERFKEIGYMPTPGAYLISLEREPLEQINNATEEKSYERREKNEPYLRLQAHRDITAVQQRKAQHAFYNLAQQQAQNLGISKTTGAQGLQGTFFQSYNQVLKI